MPSCSDSQEGRLLPVPPQEELLTREGFSSRCSDLAPLGGAVCLSFRGEGSFAGCSLGYKTSLQVVEVRRDALH